MLVAYACGDARIEPVCTGHINRTYVVYTAHERFVLQWVNPIFAASIHDNIELVTRHLEEQGMATPRLVRNLAGELASLDAEGGRWRLMTHVRGDVHDVARDPDMCASAGALVGRFHRAVQILGDKLVTTRGGVHDTKAHLARLEQAVASHEQHRAHARIAKVAQAILTHARALPSLDELPQRVVHGDLKLSNIIFAPPGHAHCLIDLDTLGHMPFVVELGDAWRSWCNSLAEDDPASSFNLDLFAGAVRGYASTARDLLTAQEQELIVAGIETIAVELAARFCRDALEERYFGWDQQRFEAAWAHNLQRASSQLHLAASIAAQRQRAEQVARAAFAAHT